MNTVPELIIIPIIIYQQKGPDYTERVLYDIQDSGELQVRIQQYGIEDIFRFTFYSRFLVLETLFKKRISQTS